MTGRGCFLIWMATFGILVLCMLVCHAQQHVDHAEEIAHVLPKDDHHIHPKRQERDGDAPPAPVFKQMGNEESEKKDGEDSTERKEDGQADVAKSKDSGKQKEEENNLGSEKDKNLPADQSVGNEVEQAGGNKVGQASGKEVDQSAGNKDDPPIPTVQKEQDKKDRTLKDNWIVNFDGNSNCYLLGEIPQDGTPPVLKPENIINGKVLVNDDLQAFPTCMSEFDEMTTKKEKCGFKNYDRAVYCRKAQFYGKRGIAGARVFGVGMEKVTIAEDHLKYFMQSEIFAIFEGCAKCKKGHKVSLRLFHYHQVQEGQIAVEGCTAATESKDALRVSEGDVEGDIPFLYSVSLKERLCPTPETTKEKSVVSLDNTFNVNLVFEHNCGRDIPDDKPMSIHTVTFSKLIDIQHIKNTNAFEMRHMSIDLTNQDGKTSEKLDWNWEDKKRGLGYTYYEPIPGKKADQTVQNIAARQEMDINAEDVLQPGMGDGKDWEEDPGKEPPRAEVIDKDNAQVPPFSDDSDWEEDSEKNPQPQDNNAEQRAEVINADDARVPGMDEGKDWAEDPEKKPQKAEETNADNAQVPPIDDTNSDWEEDPEKEPGTAIRMESEMALMTMGDIEWRKKEEKDPMRGLYFVLIINYFMMINLGESDASSDRFTSFGINFLGILFEFYG